MPARSNKSAVTQKRAGTEARPYTKNFDIHQLDSTFGREKTWQRAAGWNVERVVREPKVESAIEWLHQCSPATSANTRGIYPASGK